MTFGDMERRFRAEFPARVIDTWMQEFGYRDLLVALAERWERLERELTAHGKRLADRASSAPKAQFDSRRMTGRAGVIR